MNLNELIALVTKHSGDLHFDSTIGDGQTLVEAVYWDNEGETVRITRIFNADGTPDTDQSDFDAEHEGEEIKTVDPVLAYVEEQLVAHNAKLLNEIKFNPNGDFAEDGMLAGTVHMDQNYYNYNADEIRVFNTTKGYFCTDLDGNDIVKPKVVAEETEAKDYEAIYASIETEYDKDEDDDILLPKTFEEFLSIFAMNEQGAPVNSKHMRAVMNEFYGEETVGEFLDLVRSLAYEYMAVPTTVLNPALDMFIMGVSAMFDTDVDYASYAKGRVEATTEAKESFSFMDLIRRSELAGKVMEPYHDLCTELIFLTVPIVFGKEEALTFASVIAEKHWDESVEEQGGVDEAMEYFYANVIRETSCTLAKLMTGCLLTETANLGEAIGYSLEDLQDFLVNNTYTILVTINQTAITTLASKGVTDTSYLNSNLFDKAYSLAEQDFEQFNKENPDVDAYVESVKEEDEEVEDMREDALRELFEAMFGDDEDKEREPEQKAVAVEDDPDGILEELQDVLKTLADLVNDAEEHTADAFGNELPEPSSPEVRAEYQEANKALIEVFNNYEEKLEAIDLPDPNPNTVGVSFAPQEQVDNCVNAMGSGIEWFERASFHKLDNDVIMGLFLNNLVNLDNATNWLVNMITVREQVKESRMRLCDLLDVTLTVVKQTYENLLPSLLKCRFKSVVEFTESYMDVLEQNAKRVSLAPASDSSEEGHQLYILSSALTAKQGLELATEILKATGDYKEPEEGMSVLDFAPEQPSEETAEMAREKAIVKAYKDNEALDSIKTCYNLDSNGALYSILRKHQVEPRDKKQASRGVAKRVEHITSDPAKMKAILKDYNDGVVLTTIYERYNVHKNGLYYLLDLNNVPRRMKR